MDKDNLRQPKERQRTQDQIKSNRRPNDRED